MIILTILAAIGALSVLSVGVVAVAMAIASYRFRRRGGHYSDEIRWDR